MTLPPSSNENGLDYTKQINFSHFFRHSNQFWSFGGQIWAILGNLGSFLAIFDPKLKVVANYFVTSQNDRKRSRILMEMVSEVSLKTLRPFQALFCNFWVILGSFGAILGPKMT